MYIISVIIIGSPIILHFPVWLYLYIRLRKLSVHLGPQFKPSALLPILYLWILLCLAAWLVPTCDPCFKPERTIQEAHLPGGIVAAFSAFHALWNAILAGAWVSSPAMLLVIPLAIHLALRQHRLYRSAMAMLGRRAATEIEESPPG